MIEADVAIHLRKTQQRLNQMLRKKVDEYGISFRLLHIIMLIQRNPEANQKEIAKQLKISPGAMSGSIKRLIGLKMLKQVPLADDMRYNRLVVTEHGQAIIEDYEEQVHIRYKAIFEGFSQEELEKFNASLSKINANLSLIHAEQELG